MLKLMKYEFKKTQMTKLILLAITALAEIAFLIGLYLMEKPSLLSASTVLLVFLAMGGIWVIGLESIVILHRDMNTKQSYMLFMTPNSSYRILGAKVLENGLSILLAGAFFFALGALDITLLFAKEGQLSDIWRMIQDLIHSLNQEIEINVHSLASFTFNMLSNWFLVIMTAYLADVVSSALLNGKKHNGVLSFVLFIVLSIATSYLARFMVSGVNGIEMKMVLDGVISLVFSVAMYVVTAQIMERKLSV